MVQLQLKLRVLRSLTGLLLIVSTWRLWFRFDGDGEFPTIPFFRCLTEAPFALDVFLSAALISSLLLDLVRSLLGLRGSNTNTTRPDYLAAIGILVAGVLLVALDQQRLQPWLYHLLLLTPILALSCDSSGSTSKPEPNAPLHRRWIPAWQTPGLLFALTASIYAWSAWSKLDVSFIGNHGSQFVEALAGLCGLSTRFWTPGMRVTAAAALPLGELIVAITLLHSRTRRNGLMASIGMHGLLIVAVGPWGLHQRPGVILWNVYFIAQNALLIRFAGRHSPAVSADSTSLPHKRDNRLCVVVTAITMGACLAPALRLCDSYDNWPSWAVYAASTRRVFVVVDPDALTEAPQELQDCLEPRRLQDGSAWLRIDQWSLAEYNAPVYPQDRFHVAIALAVSRRFHLDDSIRLVLEGPADRFTGARHVETYADQTAIEKLAAKYRLNTAVRVR